MSWAAAASERSSLRDFRNMNSLRSMCLFLTLPACAFAQVTLISGSASNLPSAPVPQTQSQSTGTGATPMGQQATVPANAPGTPITLSLKDAQALALKNNPQISVARLTALASQQVTREVRSNLWPTATGNLTGVDSRANSRITAGGLNNPIIYERAAAGVMVSQLITDFGRTTNLISSANLAAK